MENETKVDMLVKSFSLNNKYTWMLMKVCSCMAAVCVWVGGWMGDEAQMDGSWPVSKRGERMM